MSGIIDGLLLLSHSCHGLGVVAAQACDKCEGQENDPVKSEFGQVPTEQTNLVNRGHCVGWGATLRNPKQHHLDTILPGMHPRWQRNPRVVVCATEKAWAILVRLDLRTLSLNPSNTFLA